MSRHVLHVYVQFDSIQNSDTDRALRELAELVEEKITDWGDRNERPPWLSEVRVIA